MGKYLKIFFAIILLLVLGVSAVSCTSGQPNINVIMYNVPEDPFVDILVQNPKMDFSDMDMSVVEKYEIDPLTSSLYNYNRNDFLALNIRGGTTRYDFYDYIVDNGETVHELIIKFKGKAPEGFRVITQTSDNEIKVSNFLEYNNLYEQFTYDYKSNELVFENRYAPEGGGVFTWIGACLLIVLLASLPFLFIDIVTAMLMKLESKKIWLVSYISNLAMIAIWIISAFIGNGNYIFAIVSVVVLKVLVAGAEILIYRKKFSGEYENKMIYKYTITANSIGIASFLIFVLVANIV